jgi:hypothetical protein
MMLELEKIASGKILEQYARHEIAFWTSTP